LCILLHAIGSQSEVRGPPGGEKIREYKSDEQFENMSAVMQEYLTSPLTICCFAFLSTQSNLLGPTSLDVLSTSITVLWKVIVTKLKLVVICNCYFTTTKVNRTI